MSQSVFVGLVGVLPLVVVLGSGVIVWLWFKVEQGPTTDHEKGFEWLLEDIGSARSSVMVFCNNCNAPDREKLVATLRDIKERKERLSILLVTPNPPEFLEALGPEIITIKKLERPLRFHARLIDGKLMHLQPSSRGLDELGAGYYRARHAVPGLVDQLVTLTQDA